MSSRKNNRWARAFLAGVLSASLALSPVMPAASVAFAASVDTINRPFAVADGAVNEEAAGRSSADNAAQDSAGAAAQNGASLAGGVRASGSDDSDAAATPRDDASASGEAPSASRAAAADPDQGVPSPHAASAVAAPPSSSVTSGCFLGSAPDTRYTSLADAVDAAQDGDTIYVVSDNLDAGRRAVRCDKNLTIASAGATRTVDVRFDFAYTQGAKKLALENIVFATKYDGVLWHKRTAPLFTLDGGEMVLGKDASVLYANLNIMDCPLADGDGLTCPVRVGRDGTLRMLDGSSLRADSTYAIGGNGSAPVRGGAIYIGTGGYMEMLGGTISGFAKFAKNLEGGAIYTSSALRIEGGTISDCRATRGGAIYNTNVNSGCFAMEGGAIANCSSEEAGGAVYNDDGACAGFLGGIITGCSSVRGGAIYNTPLNDNGMGEGMRITDCSAEEGGAVYLASGPGDVGLAEGASISN